MNGAPWTRLQTEPIWAAAERAHARRLGRVYHDWDRVLRLYDRAGRVLHLPYDRPLDLAILTHSVQTGPGGDRRARSVEWLRAQADPGEPVEAAARLILAGPYRDLSDPRLPLLELSDLAFPVSGRAALRDIAAEIRLLTRLEAREIVTGLQDELNRIRRALGAALPRIQGIAMREFAREVIHGCETLTKDGIETFL
ncbi:hypothetical protein IQ03_01272 [Gemmobacter caeni]|uniref:Uncharacterized protein n=1 Tax=Gemmobacter caeni TaxID=589035 RepID=A0A2T6B8S9_9RHOB|nr:hypothetical protein [Gemmobacter caeni]PTX52475.1 hypothetical protein C8N34_102255 [Gemmobacter caeni]TWJ02854.1 hypothetical protein IQ03_01272 [Gemmobacter caeni]